MTTRRHFLRSALAAPFVARLGVLMPVRPLRFATGGIVAAPVPSLFGPWGTMPADTERLLQVGIIHMMGIPPSLMAPDPAAVTAAQVRDRLRRALC